MNQEKVEIVNSPELELHLRDRLDLDLFEVSLVNIE